MDNGTEPKTADEDDVDKSPIDASDESFDGPESWLLRMANRLAARRRESVAQQKAVPGYVEGYSEPHAMEKKNNARAASNKSR